MISRRCRSLVISIRSRHSRRAVAIHLSAIALPRIVNYTRSARSVPACPGDAPVPPAVRPGLRVGRLRGIDVRIRETRKKAAAAARVAGTSLTGLFGVGPVIAAAVIGDVRHVSRFPSRDHFAAYDGTAPIEVSSAQPPPPAPRRR
jgi:transposase